MHHRRKRKTDIGLFNAERSKSWLAFESASTLPPVGSNDIESSNDVQNIAEKKAEFRVALSNAADDELIPTA